MTWRKRHSTRNDYMAATRIRAPPKLRLAFQIIDRDIPMRLNTRENGQRVAKGTPAGYCDRKAASSNTIDRRSHSNERRLTISSTNIAPTRNTLQRDRDAAENRASSLTRKIYKLEETYCSSVFKAISA